MCTRPCRPLTDMHSSPLESPVPRGFRPPYAFYRLLWRPLMIVLVLYLMFMACILPALGLLDENASLTEMWRLGTASTAVLDALWRETVVVPVFIGFVTGAAAIEVQKAPFAWGLPALRVRMLWGTVSLLAVVAALVGVAHWGVEGWKGALAGAGVAAVAFAAGPAMLMPSYPARTRWLAAIALVAVVLAPSVVESLMRVASPFVAFAGLGGAAVVLASGFSRATARGAAMKAGTAGVIPEAPLWAEGGLGHHDRERNPLQAAGLAAWMRAAAGAGSSRAIRRLVFVLLVSIAWIVTIAYTLGNPLFVAIVMMWDSRIQLRGDRLLYPVSRKRRAQVSFLGNLGTTLSYTAIAGIELLLLFKLKPWPQYHANPTHHVGVLFVVCVTIAAAPLVQWGTSSPPIRSLTEDRELDKRSVAHLGGFLLYLILTVGSAFAADSLSSRFSTGAVVIVLVALIVSTQSIFYWRLRRAYATRDLL